jgi:hypothetical protein
LVTMFFYAPLCLARFSRFFGWVLAWISIGTPLTISAFRASSDFSYLPLRGWMLVSATDEFLTARSSYQLQAAQTAHLQGITALLVQ